MKPSLLSGAMIVALSAVLGYHGIYLRAQRDLRALQEQQTQEQQTQEVQAQLAIMLEAIERLRGRLPEKPETEALMRQVNHLTQERGVAVTSIEPESPSSISEFTRLAVTLQFATSYHQLGAFLSAIESSPLFLKVETLDVSSLGDGSSRVRLVVSTAYVPPLRPATPEPTAALASGARGTL